MLLKNCLFAGILLFMATFIFSCDSTEEEPKNSFKYDNTTFLINDVIIQDFGSNDLIEDQESDDTHYLYLFGFTDGTVVTDQQYISEDASYIMLLYCFSSINQESSDFKEGVFTYSSNQDYSSGSEELRDQNFFTSSYVLFDSDNDGFIYGDEELKFFNSGVVNINGADSTFQLFFRLDLSFGKKLDGSFAGDFDFIE